MFHHTERLLRGRDNFLKCLRRLYLGDGWLGVGKVTITWNNIDNHLKYQWINAPEKNVHFM